MIRNAENGARGGQERTDHLQEDTKVGHTGEFKASHKDDSSKIQVKSKPKNVKDGINHNALYCCHCGNCAVPNLDSYCSDCESLETTLKDLINKFANVKKYQLLLSVGIHVDYLYDCDTTHKDKQSKRTRKRQELLDKVAALLNTESGHILIHLVGRNKEDHYPGAFDEFVDKDLEALINDSRLFTEVYRKRNLSDFEGFSNYSDFLVLTVERSDYIFTSDFKTKCVTDNNIIDIKEDTLRRFLREEKSFDKDHHQVDFKKLEENPSLYESREVQLKGIHQNGEGDEWLVTHIIDKLRLPQYVSAFAKHSKGGSFVAGVQEQKRKTSIDNSTGNRCPVEFTKEGENRAATYFSKTLEYKSATIVEPKKLPSHLHMDLKRVCLVCDYKGDIENVDDLVKTTLIQHKKDSNHLKNKYIIVVSARPVRGLVFYDPEGPVAYVVSEKKANYIVDSIGRLPFNKWFAAIKQKKQI